MTPIKYAFRNMSDAIWINLIFVFQMIVVLFLFAESSDDIIRFARAVRNIRFLQENEAYIVSDTTSSEKRIAIWNSEEQSIVKASELFHSIKNCGYASFTLWSYETNEIADSNIIRQYVADPPFFDMLTIGFYGGDSVAFGETSSREIPMVVGYRLRGVYPLGRHTKSLIIQLAKASR